MEQLFNRQGEPRTPNFGSSRKPIFRYERPCIRCGGAGGSEAWRHTGWKCYRCGGNGVDPRIAEEKLYTQTKLDSLNAIKARADAKRAAIREEKRIAELARQAAEREELHTRYADLIDRLRENMSKTSLEIISDVHHQIVDLVIEPSDKQIEACTKIMDRIEADERRREQAVHVGSIKERRLFENLTLLYTRSEKTGEFPTIWSHWSLFQDEDGNKIACKSAPWVIGLEREGYDEPYTRGQKITVKATVVDHKYDKKGEPVTYINRPKAA